MPRMPIIGLAGNAGVGKDTVGTYIANNYNGICVAQADPMKRFVMNLFNWPEEVVWGDGEIKNKEYQIKYNPNVSEANWQFIKELNLQENVSAKISLNKLTDAYTDAYNDDIKLSPRKFLQLLGTEWGRQFSPDIWSDLAVKYVSLLLTPGYNYNRTEGIYPDPTKKGFNFGVITDLRFRNEHLNLMKLNGSVILITRKNKLEVTNGVKNHASETELDTVPKNWYDWGINNDGDFIELEGKTRRMMSTLYNLYDL